MGSVKEAGHGKQDNKEQSKGRSSVQSHFSLWCRLEKSAVPKYSESQESERMWSP